MKFDISDHNNGLSIITADIYYSVTNAIKNTKCELKKHSAPMLKKKLIQKSIEEGWSGQLRIDKKTRITITSIKDEVGLCIQLGNVSRMYADLLKLQVLYNKSVIKAAIIVVALNASAKKMNGNMASFERLEREYALYDSIITVPCIVIGIGED